MLWHDWIGKRLEPTQSWKTSADVVKIPTFGGVAAEQLFISCIMFLYVW